MHAVTLLVKRINTMARGICKIRPNVCINRCRLVVACLLASLLLVILSGCRERDEGIRVATAGQATATALAAYYDSLVQDSMDTWELEAIFRGTTGLPIPFTDTEQRVYQQRIDALDQRAQMARNLSALYTSFQQLTSYDAKDTIAKSYENFAQRAQQLPAIPGSDRQPEVLLAVNELLALKQTQDMRRANAIVLKGLIAVEHLVQNEGKAYRLVEAERYDKATAVGRRLLEQKKLNGKTLLDHLPELVGLPWTTGQPSLDDPVTLNAMAILLNVRSVRRKIQSERAEAAIESALQGMIQAHESLARSTGIRLDDVVNAAQEAQTILRENQMPSNNAIKK